MATPMDWFWGRTQTDKDITKDEQKAAQERMRARMKEGPQGARKKAYKENLEADKPTKED